MTMFDGTFTQSFDQNSIQQHHLLTKHQQWPLGAKFMVSTGTGIDEIKQVVFSSFGELNPKMGEKARLRRKILHKQSEMKRYPQKSTSFKQPFKDLFKNHNKSIQ